MDIIIIGGFLGGGKTTTLNHLIQKALNQSMQPAVIMNDFGQASVDSYLVDQSVPMDEMIDGCICCAMKADVSKQLHQLYLQYQPDVVFVECSGVAETQSVIDACLTPVLAPISNIASVIGVVDASLYHRIDNYPGDMQKLYYDQLTYCSHLWVNKIDLCEPDQIAEILSDLNVLNDGAEISVGTYGQLDSQTLFSHQAASIVPTQKDADACAHTPHHQGIGHRYFECVHTVELEDLVRWFETLPQSTYRVKGFVQLAEHPDVHLVQYAAGQLEIEPIQLENLVDRYLVVIGSDLNQIETPSF
ncbi:MULTISPECIES: CobW family GTP-binding protein [Staphylococcus]|uniref:CobW family GTP-binding protein n=1 Tax=Staphylococcus TaxID=1279 RepID=UPI0021D3A203|nr:GTP-binding protein [Staphylococcus sp. IVB6181]UXV35507.1 GTP-binding protein [Staphylococcus sp. IVB6181]